MNRGVRFFSEGGENVYNTRLCFGGDQGRRVLASLPPASPSLYAASVRACVLVCALLLPAPLLFAAATDEPGRGGEKRLDLARGKREEFGFDVPDWQTAVIFSGSSSHAYTGVHTRALSRRLDVSSLRLKERGAVACH